MTEISSYLILKFKPSLTANWIIFNFSFRRTEGNVLEMVEECLDITLHGNQIRYKFTDSQVLDGLTVTETMKRLIILVPTVSSLHVFTYPHPEKLSKKVFEYVMSYWCLKYIVSLVVCDYYLYI